MPYIEISSIYDNTLMKEIRNDENITTGYDISPIDGYVLHNKVLDEYEYDEDTGEPLKLISRGYSPSSSSVEPDYDFAENPSEIYAIKKEDVEENEKIY